MSKKIYRLITMITISLSLILVGCNVKTENMIGSWELDSAIGTKLSSIKIICELNKEGVLKVNGEEVKYEIKDKKITIKGDSEQIFEYEINDDKLFLNQKSKDNKIEVAYIFNKLDSKTNSKQKSYSEKELINKLVESVYEVDYKKLIEKDKNYEDIYVKGEFMYNIKALIVKEKLNEEIATILPINSNIINKCRELKVSTKVKDIKILSTDNESDGSKVYTYKVKVDIIGDKTITKEIQNQITIKKANDNYKITKINNIDYWNWDESSAESVIREYINTYYTIDKNDIDSYKKIISGTKVKDISEWEATIKSTEEKFRPLMTDTAYAELVALRMSYGRCQEASANNYYVAVKSIKLEKYCEDKEKQGEVYYYDIELTQTSIGGNEVKSVKDKKQITVSKVKGSWKVSNAYMNDY